MRKYDISLYVDNADNRASIMAWKKSNDEKTSETKVLSAVYINAMLEENAHYFTDREQPVFSIHECKWAC